jgi:2-hydroxy-3-oxopropionate reductase
VSESISLLGLGAMGAPMAERLLAAGLAPRLWNRSPAAAESFVGRAEVVPTPADAAADIVVTVFTDLDGVEAVLGGDRGLRAGWTRAGVREPVLVVMGTVSPPAVAELASALAADGIRLLDAPVSGGVVGARAGTLSIMVGGDGDALERAIPALEAMGTTIRHMGGSGSGALAKACNQLIVATGVTAISEAMLLARRSGLDLSALSDILEGGLAGSELLRQKVSNWIDEDFTPGGSAVNQLKDLNFAAQAAQAAKLDLPLATLTRHLFADLVADGDGGLDHTAIYRGIQRRSPRRSAPDPQTEESTMSAPVIVTAVFVPRPGARENVLAALERAIPAVHAEEGCELYCIQEQADGTIVMIEKWTSHATLDAHGAGPVVAALNDDLDGLLERPVAVERLVAIPIGDAGKGAI